MHTIICYHNFITNFAQNMFLVLLHGIVYIILQIKIEDVLEYSVYKKEELHDMQFLFFIFKRVNTFLMH